MRPRRGTAEEKLARIAGRNHGVVTRTQLSEAGVTPAELRHRVRVGALLRVHRGVYRVGHRAPSTEAHYLAAVRAHGSGALLSGRAAAYVLGLVRGAPPPPEVTTPAKRRPAGVETHRRRVIDRRDATVVRGIPITTVPATLVDLAAVLEAAELARAYHEAAVRYRVTPPQVEAVLARRPNAKGAVTLRAVLRGDEKVTLSALERRFLKLLRKANLLLPSTNCPVGGYWVDCRWPDQHLTVELDSYRYHGSRHAWDQDHRREREAYARGDQFRRYTYTDVFEDPRLMLEELSGLLPNRL